MKSFSVVVLSGIILFSAGCASRRAPAISDEAKYELEKSIDCSTAVQDIQILESEKASASEQAKAGVKSVVPASAAMGILRRDYRDRVEVAIGEYNRQIDEKIKEIKSQCGIE